MIAARYLEVLTCGLPAVNVAIKDRLFANSGNGDLDYSAIIKMIQGDSE